MSLDLDVRPITAAEAKAIVLPNHYSGTWNTAFGKINFGIFDGGELCGAAVFGHLMNTGSASTLADLPPGAIVELNRLWIDDRFGKNTETAMLAQCWKWLRANSRVQLVQSFADGRLGVGTIYKAANFGYYGAETTRFFRVRDTGEVFHSKHTNDTKLWRTMLHRNEQWVDGRLDTFEVYTYRYLYPLTRYARRRIKLKPQPYPKYRKGAIDSPYAHPLAVIARCQVIAEATGDPRAHKFMDYLRRSASADEVFQLLDAAHENEWVAAEVAKAAANPRLFDLDGLGA